MSVMTSVDVLIVGAGPVGLTLAIDLTQRGLKVCSLEVRQYGEPPNVKCNHVSSRTMEIFRRLGIVEQIRNSGLPEDFPNDVVFRTSMTGQELTRINIPCRRDRYTDTTADDANWPTAEPPHRINQIYLEPILLHYAASHKDLTILNQTKLIEFFEEVDGIVATVLDLTTNTEKKIRAKYLVGCDGGSSTVRKQMGSQLEGTAVIQQVQSTYIRAPKLLEKLPGKLAWCYYSVNPRRCGTVFAIDGKETWLVHNHLNPSELDFDSVDRDQSIRNILGVDENFEYEVISKEDWVGRRLVANRFRNGRVFIAGDAAHLWVPYAGYGMNAGIADATNLAWLLDAAVKGWAAPSIIDAYEAERQPITEQVSFFVMNHAAKMIKARSAVPENIEANDAEGDAARERMGKEAFELNVQQFCCAGLNFGYFYEGSPIIFNDQEKAPAYTMGASMPSTVPGCRAPYFILDNGKPIFDEFGPAYTLLCFDDKLDISALVQASQKHSMPLKVINLKGQSAVPEIYQHKLVICRTDQHIAWRGNALPKDIGAFIQTLRGVNLA